MTVFSKRLQKVAKDPSIFEQYGRGVERESLRYTSDGHLALTPHPKALGSALTNRWVTTDFSESLLEFSNFINYVSHDLVFVLLNLPLSRLECFTL